MEKCIFSAICVMIWIQPEPGLEIRLLHLPRYSLQGFYSFISILFSLYTINHVPHCLTLYRLERAIAPVFPYIIQPVQLLKIIRRYHTMDDLTTRPSTRSHLVQA